MHCECCCSCGQRVDESDRFCRRCGAATRVPTRRRRRRGPFRVTLLAVAVALLSIFAHAVVGAGAEEAAPEGGGGGDDDDVRNAERRLAFEEERQRRESLEDARALESTPKEISVHCPQEPIVSVVDLPDGAVERNECLVFRVTAPSLDARLVVKCDGEYDGGGDFDYGEPGA